MKYHVGNIAALHAYMQCNAMGRITSPAVQPMPSLKGFDNGTIVICAFTRLLSVLYRTTPNSILLSFDSTKYHSHASMLIRPIPPDSGFLYWMEHVPLGQLAPLPPS